MTLTVPHARTIVASVVAGIVGGCSILVCLAVLSSGVWRVPGTALGAYFAFDASALVGKVAYDNPNYIALGAGAHFLVSIGWAVGYAFVAEGQRQLVTRPLISGAAFGLIVYFAMQLVLVAANLYHTPSPRELGIGLLAHLVFYGIPVAVIVGRAARGARAHAR
jgi:hypothetical protein